MTAIPHNRPCLGPAENAAAARVLASGWLARGAEVTAFENEMCAYHGLPHGHALAVSSGSAALYLALWALGAAGRRVAYPAYACDALPQAIRLVNAQAVALDSAPGTPLIDFDAAASAGADVVICAGLFGLPCVLPAARTYRALMDAAQTLGATVMGQPFVLTGDVGILSFSATKLITSGGQGGMLLARDRSWIDAARDYCDFDARGDDAPRFNFQMTDLAAAIGRAQLARLPDFLARRAEIFARYRALGLTMLDCKDDAARAVRYRAVLRLPEPEALIARLAAEQIRAIAPIEPRELAAYRPAAIPQAWRLAGETVSLPCYPALDDAQLERVLAVLERG
ncbi:MAG TPA: DegT/DnrJ/EryC1/StrS family aminotransferase [Trinickia sp.]|jgi:perosamine synthetase|nr:DegT/DnrJ/EryC1/StrS family aminotransferase [Trinickia sp.]